MNKLIAIFKADALRIAKMRNAMEKRTGSRCNAIIMGIQLSPGHCRATGPAQDVMFLIGEVASNGEDCLVAVSIQGTK